MDPITRWRSVHLGVFIIAIIFLVLMFFVYVFRPSRDRVVNNPGKYESRCLIGREFVEASVVGSKNRLYLAVSRTYEELVKGLSGTPCLGEQEGMLFVFQNSGPQGIWMKDMLMPLDILWLDEEKKIVHIVETVSQYSYPKIFQPNVAAKYVVELPYGSVAKFSYKIGRKLIFNLDKVGL